MATLLAIRYAAEVCKTGLLVCRTAYSLEKSPSALKFDWQLQFNLECGWRNDGCGQRVNERVEGVVAAKKCMEGGGG